MSAASLEEEVRRVGIVEHQGVVEPATSNHQPLYPNLQRMVEGRRMAPRRRRVHRRTSMSLRSLDVLSDISWR